MRRLRTIPAVRIETIIIAITFIFGLIALIAQWRLLHTSSTVDGTTPVSLSLAGNGADPLLNDFHQDHDHGSEKALVPIEKQKPIIAILCATRSVETWKSVNDTPLQNLLIRSVGETLLNEELESWRVRLYLGIDDDDQFWIDHHSEITTPGWFEKRVFFFKKTQRNRIPFNEIAKKAFDDGSEYFVRINDDTEFLTKGWITLGVETLLGYNPPNVGVVGPSCSQGKTTIMTHDMVHKTHLQIFGALNYYPQVFRNWYCDDWITEVYKESANITNRSTQLKNWVVHHHAGTPRYEPDREIPSFLTELTLGRSKIEQFIATK